MAAPDPTDDELANRWDRALSGDPAGLEQRLVADSRLPGPRANLELAHRFADRAGAAPPEQRAAANAVLAAWLALPVGEPDPRAEYLAAVAALAAGALVAAAPDRDAGAILTAAARDPRWRVRELAATGLQRVLAADWPRGIAQARAWLSDGFATNDRDSPRVAAIRDESRAGGGALLARAAAAGVAEPALLREPAHAADACRIVADAVDVLLAVPSPDRRDPGVRVLRRALGYAVSVVAAADPDGGVPLLNRLATSADPDSRWVARENLTKARLAPLADRLAVARDALTRW
ncbi:hypothetical protein [Leifsonia sp. NPDC077715]|uniref:hypothetical protein n=1 Tax=Leifsonia sp. NPDC077715 TaxID=3155539 RepID=UPI00342949E0